MRLSEVLDGGGRVCIPGCQSSSQAGRGLLSATTVIARAVSERRSTTHAAHTRTRTHEGHQLVGVRADVDAESSSNSFAGAPSRTAFMRVRQTGATLVSLYISGQKGRSSDQHR
jgi:hypothetical protein